MQAEDDALGANVTGGASDGQLQQISYPLGGQAAVPVTSFGDDPGFGRAHLDIGQGAPAQGAPDSAALLGTSVHPQKIDLQKAGPPDTTRFSAMGAGSTVATDPTLEDAARSAPFNMTDQNLAAIRKRAEWPSKIQEGVREVIPFVAEKLSPPIVKPFVSGAFDILNHQLNELELQHRDEAYKQALFRATNGMTMQSATSQNVPPLMRGFFTK